MGVDRVRAGHLVAFWDVLGASWAVLGLFWGRLGVVLGAPWNVSEASRRRLGTSWGPLGPSWGRFYGHLIIFLKHVILETYFIDFCSIFYPYFDPSFCINPAPVAAGVRFLQNRISKLRSMFETVLIQVKLHFCVKRLPKSRL